MLGLRNPFKRASSAQLARDWNAVNARRVAYVQRKGITFPAGRLDRRERGYQRRLGRINARWIKALRRGR